MRGRVSQHRRPGPEKEARKPELRARNQRIRSDRILGASLRELAKRHGLSKARVRQIVVGVSVLVSRPRPPAKSRKRPERAEHFRRLRMLAVDLRKRGYSYRQIAARLGVATSSAHVWARRVRIVSLDGGAWRDGSGRPKEWRKALLAAPSGVANP